MAYPQGINFRSTAGYVTDTSPDDKELGGSATYPHTTAQGNNVGWEDDIGANERDRNSALDARLAGVHFTNNSASVKRYRFDLSSTGAWDVRIAAGDASYVQGPIKIEVMDTTTSLGVLCNASTSTSARWLDATAVERTAAAWVSSNAAATVTFATTICRFHLGVGSGSGSSTIAHIDVALKASDVVSRRIFLNQALNRASVF